MDMAKLSAPYRHLANPKAFDRFLDGLGALSDREEVADAYNYDRRVRKLDFERHLRSLVLLHASTYRSSRDLTWAAENDLLFKALGADFDISVSGFGQAMRGRPIEPYWHLLDRVMQAVAELPHQRLRGISSQNWKRITALFDQIDLFDATQVALPPSLCEWAQTHPDKSSFKLQLKMSGLDGHFKEALVTKPSGNDNAHFEALLDLTQGAEGLYLFDCGYFKIARYHEITRSGNYFVTKLHRNIKPRKLASPPVSDESNEAGYKVLSDDYVQLSGDDELWYRVLRVELSTGEEITILTNLLWVEAAQVCLLYRYRWSIEIVFRWLKDLLQLRHFISRDPTGIIRQMVVALIVWGLLMLSNKGGGRFSPKQLWRELQAAMHRAIFELGRRCQQAGVSADQPLA